MGKKQMYTQTNKKKLLSLLGQPAITYFSLKIHKIKKPYLMDKKEWELQRVDVYVCVKMYCVYFLHAFVCLCLCVCVCVFWVY